MASQWVDVCSAFGEGRPSFCFGFNILKAVTPDFGRSAGSRSASHSGILQDCTFVSFYLYTWGTLEPLDPECVVASLFPLAPKIQANCHLIIAGPVGTSQSLYCTLRRLFWRLEFLVDCNGFCYYVWIRGSSRNLFLADLPFAKAQGSRGSLLVVCRYGLPDYPTNHSSFFQGAPPASQQPSPPPARTHRRPNER